MVLSFIRPNDTDWSLVDLGASGRLTGLSRIWDVAMVRAMHLSLGCALRSLSARHPLINQRFSIGEKLRSKQKSKGRTAPCPIFRCSTLSLLKNKKTNVRRARPRPCPRATDSQNHAKTIGFGHCRRQPRGLGENSGHPPETTRCPRHQSGPGSKSR